MLRSRIKGFYPKIDNIIDADLYFLVIQVYNNNNNIKSNIELHCTLCSYKIQI